MVSTTTWSDETLYPSLTVWTNFRPIGQAGVAWNQQKERSSLSPELLALTSSRVEFSAPLLAKNERVCALFACRLPPGGSPKRNGASMISRCLSTVMLLIPRPIYLLCTRIRVLVNPLSRFFLQLGGNCGLLMLCDRIRLHILRASDGKGHPRAVMSIIAHQVDGSYSPADLSISGSQVCLCPKSSPSYDTIVWEWTTGKLILVRFEAKVIRVR